jgi:hypothetical protein
MRSLKRETGDISSFYMDFICEMKNECKEKFS